MGRPDIYIGLERHEGDFLSRIGELSPDGVIIGHPFCDILSGRYGEYELPSIAAGAKSLGLKVVYQTPVYVTSRNFDRLLALVRYLVENNVVDHLLVHDPGVITSLPEGDYETVWDQFGYSRGYPTTDVPFSKGTLDFWAGRGIDKFLFTFDTLKILDKKNWKPGYPGVMLLSSRLPASFSRICYSMYLTGGQCCNGSACKDEVVIGRNGEPDYYVNGYSLEQAVKLPRTIPKKIISSIGSVYIKARDIDDAKDLKSRLGKMK